MPDHVPTIRPVRARSEIRGLDKYGNTTTVRAGQVTQYVVTCPGCRTTEVFGGTRESVQLLCDEHEREHHPDRRPAPVALAPAHTLTRTRPVPPALTRLDCACGLGWTGPLDDVAAVMADHLTITLDELHVLLAPPPAPEPEPVDTPPAVAGWGPEYP